MIKRTVVATGMTLALLTAGSGAPVALAAVTTPAPAHSHHHRHGEACPMNLLWAVCVTFDLVFGDSDDG